MEIQYYKKTVYGVDKYYIEGSAADIINSLTGKKTIDIKDINNLIALGINMVYIAK